MRNAIKSIVAASGFLLVAILAFLMQLGHARATAIGADRGTASSGGGGLTEAAADLLYCKLVGCTMTGSITFSGVATDLTTASGEALTLAPAGAGGIVLTTGSNTVVVNDSAGGPDLTVTTSTASTRTTVCSNLACMGSSGNDYWHVGISTNRASTAQAGAFADSVVLGSATDLFAVYGEGKNAVSVQQAASCAAGVLALDPTSSVVYINANSNPCAITLGEANAIVGSDVLIVLTANVSGAVTFPNVANVHAGPTLCTTTGLTTIGSTYRIHYASTISEYVGVACTSN